MLLWIPLLPFVGFLVNNFGARALPKRVVGAVASVAMLAAFGVSALAISALVSLPAEEREIVQTVFTWIGSADFQVPLGLRLDPLSALMILVITGIGFLIHLYSTAYMIEEEPSEYARYFAYFESLCRVHAAPRARRQLHRAVRRLGRRGALLVSAHRLLVQESICRRRRQESVHRQSHRRRRVHSRRAARLHALRIAQFQGAERRHCGSAGRGDVWSGLDHRVTAVHRRHGQVRSDSAVHLAAGRDGRPDPCVRPHSCRDDGNGGCLFDWPKRGAVRACTGRPDDCGRHRHCDGALGGRDRHGAERHQARARVLDRVAARLHVHGDGGRRLRGRHLPSVHARVLQGVAVPRIGCGHSRAGRRAGSAPYGRAEKRASGDLLDVPDRRARHRGRAWARRFFQQGRDSLSHVLRRPHSAVGRGRDHIAHDGVLYVPAGLPGVSRRRRRQAAAYGAPRIGAHTTSCRWPRTRTTRRICTTRRDRWRWPSSCWRSGRCSPVM